jgi:hypothetical protein
VQSHLCTEDYNDAIIGLRRVRRVRRFTQWLQYPFQLSVVLTNKALVFCRLRRTGDTNLLVWSKESCYHPTIGHAITRLVNDAQHLPFHEVDDCPARERTKPETSAKEHAIDVAEGW